MLRMGQTHKVVVLEMAILDGRDDFYKHADIVVAVTTSPEVRVRRLMESRGFSEEDARNRLCKSSTRREPSCYCGCGVYQRCLRNFKTNLNNGGILTLPKAFLGKFVLSCFDCSE